jgi:Na+-translocating ferredoxin:NAD+ oxidoreductase subunit D
VGLVTGIAWLISPTQYANPVFHLLSGGLFLGAFFMATDMVTSPVTRKGMLIFGIGCGLLTAVIRLWGGFPEGVSFAILLMNSATPLIDRYTKPKVFGTGRKLYEEAKVA